MKNPIFYFLLFLDLVAQGQTPDTAALHMEIDSLIALNRSLLKEQKFEEALFVIQQAEEKCSTGFKGEIALHGKILSEKGLTYKSGGDTANAEQSYIESLNILEKAIGRNHPDYASSLYSLALLYKEMSKLKESEQLYIEANTIWQEVLGRERPEYALGLKNLADLYSNMGKYDKAEPLYLEAKEIREKVFGKDHPLYASSLNNVASLYFNLGEYEKVEPLYLDVKAIRAKVLGKGHPDYAISAANTAILYFQMGNYEKAEPLFLEAKEIFEKVHGKEHADYAWSLSCLGTLYHLMGQFEKAEILYLEAIKIQGNGKGKNSPDYTVSLHNLASLYSVMGNLEKAEPLFLESKAIREKVLGKDHPLYASSLTDLANLQVELGKYANAEQLYLEALTINEKTLGRDHPKYAICLQNMATMYSLMGVFDKAEPPYLESKAIREKALGKNHPDYAWSLNNLADFYKNIGNYKKAEPLYLESKAIREKALGKNHPDYSTTLKNLAILYEKMNNFEKAEPLLLEVSELGKSLLTKASRHLSERELLKYINKFTDFQNVFLSFAQTQHIFSGSIYDNTLFYKGFLLNASQQVSRLAQTDSTSTEMFVRLKAFNRRLASKYAKPLEDRKGVVELEGKANSLEKELTRSVAGLDVALMQVNWQEVQASLKPSEAAIEFIHYQFHDPDHTDSTMYAALVLREDFKQPLFVSLFEEKSLDSLLLLHQDRRSDYVNDLYAFAERGAVAIGKPKKTLYDLIWHPLGKELEGIKTVYFSPSGLLHRINLGSIPLNDEETISDQFNLIQVNSTRQLVIPHLEKPLSDNAVLFGGIMYETDSTSLAEANSNLLTETVVVRGELSFNYSDSTLRGDNWKYLSWTKKEVETISEILKSSDFKTTTRTDYQATEEFFRTIGQKEASPRILHIATHGFFFPDPISTRTASEFSDEPVFRISEHPMIRSGLILAGGNRAWQNKPAFKGMEDGILTAYEISQMNLASTELIVLSACETGLGDIQGNEGVYGLQRAFKIAGAKYLIMSLWQVPDFQTQELMTTFYSKWLEEKMVIPDAFRLAQKEMRDKYQNPYFWAGFVLVE